MGPMLKHNPYLQELASRLGKVESIMSLEGCVVVVYQAAVEVPPEICINPNSDNLVELIYCHCYCTPADIQTLEETKGLSLLMSKEVFVPALISDFNQHENIISCMDENTLFLINAKTHLLKRFSHTHFLIGVYPPYLCVVMEYKYMCFYENWN